MTQISIADKVGDELEQEMLAFASMTSLFGADFFIAK